MKRGISLLVIATLLWGGNYICGRYMANALPATLLNTIRWGISSVILIVLLSISKKRLQIWRMWKEFMILGFFGIFAFSTLTYLGLGNLNASQAGMISAGIPIAILFFTPFVLKEKVKNKAWVGAIISVIGVILLLQGKHIGGSNGSVIGEIEIILASLSWGLYTVLGKRFGKQIDPLTMTAGASIYGTIFSGISCIGTVSPEMIHMTGIVWLCITYVSTFASVGAYLAWNAGVKIIGAGRAAPFINLLPVWTVLLGLLLLHEQVTFLSLIGGIITIFGAVLASLQDKQKYYVKQG